MQIFLNLFCALQNVKYICQYNKLICQFVKYIIMSDFCESEKRRFDKMNKFQLPHRFKKIGWSVVLIAFLLMIAKKFVDEPSWVKPVLRNVFVLGMLIVSLAKEKIEDELIKNIRAQSFRLAFIFGVIYSIVLPYLDYGIEYLMDSKTATLNFDYFQIIISMLLVQIAFFYSLKRSY